jgi:hypothetical protein
MRATRTRWRSSDQLGTAPSTHASSARDSGARDELSRARQKGDQLAGDAEPGMRRRCKEGRDVEDGATRASAPDATEHESVIPSREQGYYVLRDELPRIAAVTRSDQGVFFLDRSDRSCETRHEAQPSDVADEESAGALSVACLWRPP